MLFLFQGFWFVYFTFREFDKTRRFTSCQWNQRDIFPGSYIQYLGYFILYPGLHLVSGTREIFYPVSCILNILSCILVQILLGKPEVYFILYSISWIFYHAFYSQYPESCILYPVTRAGHVPTFSSRFVNSKFQP